MSVRAGVAAHDVAVAVEEYATVGRSINTSSAATTAKVKAMAAAKVMADDATKTDVEWRFVSRNARFL